LITPRLSSHTLIRLKAPTIVGTPSHQHITQYIPNNMTFLLTRNQIVMKIALETPLDLPHFF
jgi:hypothetical protein